PLTGASMIETGTTNGPVFDVYDKISINVSSSESALLISYIGYEPITDNLDGRSKLSIARTENAATLDEVVVVGYGSQKRSDVTGAIASANIKAFEEAPNTNIAQSLQGTVPGLSVGQVNTAGGTPEITIRGQVSLNGSQSVLIVLDGIQYNGSLSSINPNDIESIDVLKDVSSTAVYGAQAANGVILITSKGGKRNQKPQISISSSYATLQPSQNIRP